jgi:hypothetical protein
MARSSRNDPHKISTLNEKHLHAALKEWYARPDDLVEEYIDGYLVDLVRGDLMIEIQTRNFSAIRRKLRDLAARRPVRLVYPIAQEKWIVKLAKNGTVCQDRRKSPKRGVLDHLFEELVSIPGLLSNPNFSLEVLLIQEEEVRRQDASRGWRRRGWLTHERRLLDVMDQKLLETPAQMAELFICGLSEPFTTSELAGARSIPRWLAQKMAYCLREMGVVEPIGKRGNAIIYSYVR